MLRRFVVALLFSALFLVGRSAFAQLVDLTPTTGTQYTSAFYYTTHGYKVSFNSVAAIQALEMKATLASNDTITAHVWDVTNQTVVATGSVVSGNGTEQFYRSVIGFTPVVGRQYILGFYLSNPGVTSRTYKSSPTFPYTVGPMSVVSHNSSLVTTMDQFPSYTYYAAAQVRVLLSTGIYASPTPIDFSQVTVNTTATQRLTLGNLGTTSITVSALALSGTNAADYSYNATLPITIAPAGTAQIDLSFKPAAIGARPATLTVTSNDTQTPTMDLPLAGTGTNPAAGVAPTTLAFGEIRVGQASAPHPVVISNTGNGPLTISALDLTGPQAARFVGTTVTLPLVIPAGNTKQLDYVFSPTETGAANASLGIKCDDPATPNLTVPFTGSGTAPKAKVGPQTLDFGPQLVSKPSAAKGLDLVNEGSAPLVINNMFVTGPQSGTFSFLGAPPTLPITLGPGQKKTYPIVFKPVIVGDAAASMRLLTDDFGASTIDIDLRGSGANTVVTATPGNLTFGDVDLGQEAKKEIVIANASGGTLSLKAPVFAVAGAPYRFDGLSGAIEPGGKRTVTVVFAPKTGGTWDTDVTLSTGDASQPPLTMGLHGNAVDPNASNSGCGCRVGPNDTVPPWAWLLAPLASLAWIARRRSRRATR